MTRTLIYEAASCLLTRYSKDTSLAIWANELKHRMGYKKGYCCLGEKTDNINVEYVEIRDFL